MTRQRNDACSAATLFSSTTTTIVMPLPGTVGAGRRGAGSRHSGALAGGISAYLDGRRTRVAGWAAPLATAVLTCHRYHATYPQTCVNNERAFAVWAAAVWHLWAVSCAASAAARHCSVSPWLCWYAYAA